MNLDRTFILNLIFLLTSIGICGCTQYVCPAYQSAFLATQEDADYFFSYYQDDSILFQNDLMASRDKSWNGLVQARPYAIGLPPVRPSRNQNYPKVILQKKLRIIPDTALEVIKDSTFYLNSSSEGDDVTIDELPLDDFVSEEESKEIATDEDESNSIIVENADSLDINSGPPMRYDQYYYMKNYGLALLEADSLRQAAKADSLAAKNNTSPDSLILNPNRKKWQFWKPKYIQPDSISNTNLSDSITTEGVDENKFGSGLFNNSGEEEEPVKVPSSENEEDW
ncbi:hypothetical protein [Sediminitomix flava]|uniref:Lipoprotein n=1 Tax=Sediminitomix flava TaxID=379075 RepID=A0A315ZAY7_SEDFL|nr:hypothetical protein [Sediminitomix flava]PWJ42520.1 hypothetical protein BC781_10263 [Sediminitomix flava]